MSNIVNATWLKENKNNDKLVIVDCRFSLMDKEYGKRSYNESHIENALRVDIETQLSAPVQLHGGRHPLPTVEDLTQTFQNLGINQDSIVVAYDEGDLAGPSRLFWILKYLGHNEVYVLDGGINAYEAIGGKVTNEVNLLDKGNFTPNVQEDMKVSMQYVKERLHNDNVAIVDCREAGRYNGEFEPVDIKCGHIPSAKNYFWMNILNEKDGKLSIKNNDELKKYFEDLKNYEEVIIYCGSGITASPVSLALNESSIKHKFYSGSFSDWVSYEDNKVDTINK